MMPVSVPPTPPIPALQRAATWLAEGRLHEAVAVLEALTAAAPTYAAAQVLLATALSSAGDAEASLQAWNKASILVPRSPVVQRERRKLLEAQEDADLTLESPVYEHADTISGEAEPGDKDAPNVGTEQAPDIWKETVPSAPVGPAVDATRDAIDLAPADSHAESLDEDGDLAPSDSVHASIDDPSIDMDGAVNVAESAIPDLSSIEVDSPEIASGEARTPVELRQSAKGEASGDGASHVGHPSSFDDLSLTNRPSDLEVISPEARLAKDSPAPTEEAPSDWTLLMEEVDKNDVSTASPAELLAPEAPDVASGASVSSELDALISQLEDAPRIRPDPAYNGPLVSLSGDSPDDMASETLAQIYAAQNQFEEAGDVYERLADRNPSDASRLMKLAAEMRSRV